MRPGASIESAVVDTHDQGRGLAFVVILAGVSAALHLGKLPPALPVLRESLGITLVQAGFLLSTIQLAGMLLGLPVGLAADGLGLRRCMITGLLVLAAASICGGFAQDAGLLLVLRAVEGAGFLLVAMPAPSLIRRLVPPARMSGMMGFWGAYMPSATGAALLCGPLVIALAGWAVWWWLLAGLSAVMALALLVFVPADPSANGVSTPGASDGQAAAAQAANAWPARLSRTLRSPGPWAVAIMFAVYSGQWMAVIGFLPSIYAQAGVAGGLTALLTALVAASNMGGNIVSGRLLQRGLSARKLLYTGFVVMAAGSWLAFGTALPLPPAARYGAVLAFSLVGGVIPSTLFSLSVLLAPDERTLSTTVGWMHQCSAMGQFLVPPLVAWVASRVGGWHWTWAVTGACSAAGLLIAWRLPAPRPLSSP